MPEDKSGDVHAVLSMTDDAPSTVADVDVRRQTVADGPAPVAHRDAPMR